MDSVEFRKTVPAQERLEKSSAKSIDHINRKLPINNRQRQHAKEWANEAAHAAFELHPELREEGSMLRYFVAKAGRKQGIYGAALTEFVEKEYEKGTWWKHIPEEVIKSKM